MNYSLEFRVGLSVPDSTIVATSTYEFHTYIII